MLDIFFTNNTLGVGSAICRLGAAGSKPVGWRWGLLWRLWTRLRSIWVSCTSFPRCWSIWIWSICGVWELFSPGNSYAWTLDSSVLVSDPEHKFWWVAMWPTVFFLMQLPASVIVLTTPLHLLDAWTFTICGLH